MGELLNGIYKQLSSLESALNQMLKEEKHLEDSVLVKMGYIIRKYTVRLSSINTDNLEHLKKSMAGFLALEINIRGNIRRNLDEISKIASDYKRTGNLQIDLFLPYFDKAVECSKNVYSLVDNLIQATKGKALYEKTLSGDIAAIITAVEENTVNIMRFILFLKQLSQKMDKFETDAYYPEPKTYGRVMSPDELSKTIKNGCLSSSQDPTPVFDSPRAVIERILRMSKDERKDFFKIIGVRRADGILFFQTRLKPVNYDRPVPQSNGLREFKFPRGIRVNVIKAA